MDRRQLLKAGWPGPWPLRERRLRAERSPIYIADMHFHLFFFGPAPAATAKPLAREMAAGKATLVAWSLVGDLLWMRPTPRGLKQKGVPKAGETLAWFQRELARIKAYIAEQNLKIVRTPADVDLALKGEPHVVLSVEGASFLDDDLAPGAGRLRAGHPAHPARALHPERASATSRPSSPQHNGLSDFGKKVVEECNRLGILIDLAHCTDDAVSQALAISKVPMVWSHSSVTRDAQAALVDAGLAGPAAEPRRRKGHRRQGRRGRPVGAAHRRGLHASRATPTGCRRWRTGWARTTSPSAPT